MPQYRISSALLLLLLRILLHISILCSHASPWPSISPTTIKIGTLLAANSTIGKVAQPAIQLALRHINSDPRFSHASWTLHHLHSFDTNCTAFQAAAAATELMREEVVAIIGPQSSTSAHFVAQMGNAVHVPLLSFAATDPALSEFQYPYFFRIAHSDALQMEAVAGLIQYYGWRRVTGVYTDDDFGTNGIFALDDALVSVGARIEHKAALAPGISATGISNILIQLITMEPRVFVVHMQQDIGLMFFSVARELGLISTGYVWIITDAMAATLVTSVLDSAALESIQGLIGTRSFIPNSHKYQSFLTEFQSATSTQLNVYGIYAYDSMWLLAYAIDSLSKTVSSFSFEDAIAFPRHAGGNSDLTKLKVFKQGSLLRQQILQTKFKGISGDIQLDMKGDLMGSEFEIVNLVGKEFNIVGYWSKKTGISSSLTTSSDIELGTESSVPPTKRLQHVIWPGGTLQTPRGWVLPENGKPLRIAVPYKVGYEQFVNIGNSSNNSTFTGFCIDVFVKAHKLLPYAAPYKFTPYGTGHSTPVYDEMITRLADQVFDAVVGDVTITTNRLRLVDFTQPYIESGLAVLAPVSNSSHNYAWAFLRPFTLQMWLTTGAFFLFTGVVVWILEHKKNRNFRGRPRKQIVTILWFSFSTLFFAQRENTRSILGRCVLLIWLFVVLIINSNYTANLTSILTVQQLAPTIQGISSLQTSDVPIGYQTGSFVKEYLKGLNIAANRLKPLNSIEKYASALKLGPERGGVAAIVDELPYIQVFMKNQCGFTVAGHEFTKGGWGFAFPKNSELVTDFSTAILKLSETGELQKIHDFWLKTGNCASTDAESDQLGLKNFWGLFVVTGISSIICLSIYIAKSLWEFTRHSGALHDNEGRSSSSSWGSRSIKSFVSYI